MKNASYICQSYFLGLRTSLFNAVARIVDHVQFQLTAEIIICDTVKHIMQMSVHGTIYNPGTGAIASGNGAGILIVVIESFSFQIIKVIRMVANNSAENIVLLPSDFFIEEKTVGT